MICDCKGNVMLDYEVSMKNLCSYQLLPGIQLYSLLFLTYLSFPVL